MALPYTTSPSGSLTWVEVSCPDEATAAALRARIGRVYTPCSGSQPGRVVVRCNRAEMARVVGLIEAFKAEPPAAMAAPGSGRRPRILVRDDGRAAPATLDQGGVTLQFAGFGRGFLGGEADGVLWGEPVRYAYYA